ncbi:hypothetical protein B0H10DRAFT_2222398 [Mycena sp. CBHHK59/15]|nr:hypothetical protein B0H10DRAFT_2222398 [Mycena sp. CBHHK59/15]
MLNARVSCYRMCKGVKGDSPRRGDRVSWHPREGRSLGRIPIPLLHAVHVALLVLCPFPATRFLAPLPAIILVPSPRCVRDSPRGGICARTSPRDGFAPCCLICSVFPLASISLSHLLTGSSPSYAVCLFFSGFASWTQWTPGVSASSGCPSTVSVTETSGTCLAGGITDDLTPVEAACLAASAASHSLCRPRTVLGCWFSNTTEHPPADSVTTSAFMSCTTPDAACKGLLNKTDQPPPLVKTSKVPLVRTPPTSIVPSQCASDLTREPSVI